MPSAEHAVTIERPVGEVFAYVLDGKNATAWRPSVSDIEKATPGPDRVGTRYTQKMKGGPGGSIPADYELTEVVPDRTIGFKVVAGPAHPTGRYDFESLGPNSTRLRFRLDFEPKGIKERLIAPMVGRTMPKEVATLDDLKRVLEARSPAS